MALILAVDDHAINREFLSTLLGYAGHRVIEAADGSTALDMAQEFRPDLVISDIVMPTMDGFEFARRLRIDPATAGIPLVFYTASYRLDDALGLAASCGASAVIAKPSRPQVILDTVAAALGAPAGSSAPAPALTDRLPHSAEPDLTMSLRLSLLLELGLDLAARREPQSMLNLACRACGNVFGADYAGMGIVSATTGKLSRLALHGLAGDIDTWLAAFGQSGVIPNGQTDGGKPRRMVGPAASAGLPAGHPPVESLLLVPLASALCSYGWLYVAKRPGSEPFGAADEQIALMLAAHVAMAYENLLLYETLQVYAARLEADSTSIKRLNEQIEQASRAKSAFLANMSHEIRTPLNGIIGLSHLLRRDITDPVQKGWLDQLCASSDHLLALLNDVLDLSKIEADRLVLDESPFRFGSLIERVREMTAAPALAKGLAFTAAIDPRLRDAELRGDALRLAQILINLGSNAVKFTEQGTVRLEIEVLADNAEGMTLRFAIADSGIGIDPNDQSRLFHNFTQIDGSPTRTHGGTGLGLAISQRLAGMMGGKIEVESQPGVGSRFSFELTLPRARVAREAVPEQTAFLQGKQVLCAEDHPLSQEILLEMLTDLGCEVDMASDGAEAVERASARSYDIILMDMQMPRMDGIAGTRAIRALSRHRDTPIIALTANAFADDRQRCVDAGMNGYLVKPVTPALLAAGLVNWLPGLATPAEETPCENALSRALDAIPGLEIPPVWRRSPQHLADYCAQLNRMVRIHGRDMARLREHLAAGGHDDAHVVAHRLTGIAGLLGARRIASLAQEIVQALREGADASVIERHAELCEAELTRLAEASRMLPLHLSNG